MQTHPAIKTKQQPGWKALLPGEGEVLAVYCICKAKATYPTATCGKIGYDAEDVDNYEKSGYVVPSVLQIPRCLFERKWYM